MEEMRNWHKTLGETPEGKKPCRIQRCGY